MPIYDQKSFGIGGPLVTRMSPIAMLDGTPLSNEQYYKLKMAVLRAMPTGWRDDGSMGFSCDPEAYTTACLLLEGG